MSDDEYYANSDEFDDLLWDDGASQDLAGDLAEHTIHSPVWQDDPNYELQYGFSDWDYYSDDYYDDDPKILNHNPQDGSPLRQPRKLDLQQSNKKRGRKRKLAETEDIPPLSLVERPTLEQTITGVVWATADEKPPSPYQEGQSEKVALLRNWKDLFGGTHQRAGKPKGRNFGKGRPKRDDSWANDMSLEDMGLRTARGKEEGEPSGEGDEEDKLEEAAYHAEEGGECGEDQDQEQEQEQEAERPLVSRKRRRLASILPSPPPSNEPSTVGQPSELNMSDSAPNDHGPEPVKRGRGRPRKNIIGNIDVGISGRTLQLTEYSMVAGNGKSIEDGDVDSASTRLEATTLAASAGHTNSTQGRKRKASSTDDREPDLVSSTTNRQAKRIASSKLSTKQDETTTTQPIPTRATRSRKK